MFGRRRDFDRQQLGAPNSTGYQEKTVFSTAPVDNMQNGYAQSNDYAQSGGYAQQAPDYSNGYAQNNGYASGNGYAQGGTATEVRDMQSDVTRRELPMVFASREHSDIYIYEYSDRLEYYLKTATSMYRFNTVKK